MQMCIRDSYYETLLKELTLGIKQLVTYRDAHGTLCGYCLLYTSGGRTGRIRRQFHIPAMGDIRSVMCAMAEEETMFTSLMNFRFDGDDSDVGGHNLVNLILTALTPVSYTHLDVYKRQDEGGTIIACGTPEEVAQVENSYTGQYLKKVL